MITGLTEHHTTLSTSHTLAHLLLLAIFANEETEAQIDYVNCSRSHSW